MNKLISIFLLTITSISVLGQTASNEITREEIDDGLYITEYQSPQKSLFGDSKITMLKIDPSKYNFNLFSAKENGESNRTAKQWGEQKNLIAVINAGMFLSDYTNVGFMKDYDFSNNNRMNNDNTIVAFNRKSDSLPQIQIIDLVCQNWNDLKNSYNSFTQSIRMGDCNLYVFKQI